MRPRFSAQTVVAWVNTFVQNVYQEEKQFLDLLWHSIDAEHERYRKMFPFK